MEGIFRVLNPELLENKSVLLIDDVITTSATMASCVRELNKIKGVRVYVAALAFSAP